MQEKKADDISGWTSEDEARAVVQNRGLATDKYVRGSRLGSGGWSVVYKVRRVADGRVFAGKASKAVAELRKEAGVLGRLEHAHVLRLVDWHDEAGEAGAALLVTELCAHGTVQARIDRAAPNMERREVLEVVRQMGGALAYLHAQGLVHTDVKPRNMLVRGVRPRIDVVLGDCADVRTAAELAAAAAAGPGPGGGRGRGRRRRGSNTGGSNTGGNNTRGSNGNSLRGTPAYYSPEMVRHGRHVGPGDDVWALGVAALGMAAQWPALRPTDDEVRRYPGRCAEHAARLRALNGGHGLVALVARMLAPERDGRAAAGECARAAAELLAGEERSGGRAGHDGHDLGIKAPEDFRPVSFW